MPTEYTYELNRSSFLSSIILPYIFFKCLLWTEKQSTAIGRMRPIGLFDVRKRENQPMLSALELKTMRTNELVDIIE